MFSCSKLFSINTSRSRLAGLRQPCAQLVFVDKATTTASFHFMPDVPSCILEALDTTRYISSCQPSLFFALCLFPSHTPSIFEEYHNKMYAGWNLVLIVSLLCGEAFGFNWGSLTAFAATFASGSQAGIPETSSRKVAIIGKPTSFTSYEFFFSW